MEIIEKKERIEKFEKVENLRGPFPKTTKNRTAHVTILPGIEKIETGLIIEKNLL